MDHEVRAAFAARLHEVCDDLDIPTHGRQTELARRFDLTPNAARKWLKGEGMPNLDVAIAIAGMAGVNVNWLLQGVGPKRVDYVDTKAFVLADAITALRAEDGQQVLDYLGYKIDRSGPLITGPRLTRYRTALEAFRSEIMKRRRRPNGAT